VAPAEGTAEESRNASQKHVWRAQIVLVQRRRSCTSETMRLSGKSEPCVWHWQERFLEEGVDGLLRDKTRKDRKAPLGPEVAKRVVAI
jgi:hypothetical protein